MNAQKPTERGASMATPPDPVAALAFLKQRKDCALEARDEQEAQRYRDVIALVSSEGAMRVALKWALDNLHQLGEQTDEAEEYRELLSSPGSPREDGWQPRFENSQQFAALCADHPLPWNFDIDYTAIVDAEGGYVIELADTRDRNLRLGNMLLVGVNTCGGFRAQVDGAWSATPPLQPGSALAAEKEANSADKS